MSDTDPDPQPIEPDADESTALYRLYDACGVLLYVGISKDFGYRWKQHAHAQPWWPEVNRQSVAWYPSRKRAGEEEIGAIQTERPKYNKQHAALGPLVSDHGQCCRCNEASSETDLDYDYWPEWYPSDIHPGAWWRPMLKSIGCHEVLDTMVCPVRTAIDAFGEWFSGSRDYSNEDPGRPLAWAQQDSPQEDDLHAEWSAHADITHMTLWSEFGPEQADAQEEFLRALVAAGRCDRFSAGRSAVAFGFRSWNSHEAQFAGAVLGGLMWGGVKPARECTAILLEQAAEDDQPKRKAA